MLTTAINFLLTTVADLLTLALLLRFFLQYFKASFQNPLAQIAMTATNFIVKPARKWIPSWKKLDVSTLVLALVVQLLLLIVLRFLIASGVSDWLNLGLLAIVKVVKLSLELFFYAILMQAILSWVNPATPISGALNALTNPILRPIRKVLPSKNGIDFSALAAIILLQMVNISFIKHLESHLNSIF